jgi:hypothetical protein
MKIRLELRMSAKDLKKAYKKTVPKKIRSNKGLAAYARNRLFEFLYDECKSWVKDDDHYLEGKIKYKGQYKVTEK